MAYKVKSTKSQQFLL